MENPPEITSAVLLLSEKHLNVLRQLLFTFYSSYAFVIKIKEALFKQGAKTTKKNKEENFSRELYCVRGEQKAVVLWKVFCSTLPIDKELKYQL